MSKIIEKTISLFGSQRAFGEAIGVRQQHVCYWLHKSKKIPPEYVLAIERATNGEVTRHELRPDIYPPEEITRSAS